MAEVKHSGVVERIDSSSVFVRMQVNSACGSCQAKSVCGAAESADKVVEVITASASDFQVGDVVEVALLSRDMGTKSVRLAYVVPFLVLAAVLVGSIALGVSEGVAVIASLVSVGLYYVGLYAMRNRIKNTIKFIIIKQTK